MRDWKFSFCTHTNVRCIKGWWGIRTDVGKRMLGDDAAHNTIQFDERDERISLHAYKSEMKQEIEGG